MFTFERHCNEPIRIGINNAQYVFITLYGSRKHAQVARQFLAKVGITAFRAFGKGALSHTSSLACITIMWIMVDHGFGIGMREVNRAITQLIQSTLAAMAKARVKQLGVRGLQGSEPLQKRTVHNRIEWVEIYTYLQSIYL